MKPREVEEMSQRMVGHDFSLDVSAYNNSPSTRLDLLADKRLAQDDELSGAQEQVRVQRNSGGVAQIGHRRVDHVPAPTGNAR